jgi:hypothetical protein
LRRTRPRSDFLAATISSGDSPRGEVRPHCVDQAKPQGIRGCEVILAFLQRPADRKKALLQPLVPLAMFGVRIHAVTRIIEHLKWKHLGGILRPGDTILCYAGIPLAYLENSNDD